VSYVFAGYLVVFGTLGAYSWRVMSRQRALARALRRDEEPIR
jgi:hypothetical protein